MRSVVSASHDPVVGETAAAEPVAIDPVILARVREAQSAIRRSLGVAERVLGSEGRRQRTAFMQAIMAKQIAATLSRIVRGHDGDMDFADSDEFRVVPYADGE